MKTIVEGKARILTGDAFYNPKMAMLRDMSVMFLKAVRTRNMRVLDSTAATGVRAIRYALEAGTKNVTLIDINKKAAAVAKKNVKLNGLKLKVMNESIQGLANEHEGSFEAIDHDPFGSPAPNMFDLMKLAWNGTNLMITATDTAVLCGAHAGACIKVYGSRPLHNEMCKEAGLRILLNFTARTAAQFNFGMMPLLSISDMHYMRVFVRLEFGADKSIASMKNTGIGAFCSKCYEYMFEKGVAPLLGPLCPKCKSKMEPFGPIWLGSMRDRDTIMKMRKNSISDAASEKMDLLYEELDVPMFYSVPKLTKRLGVTSVSHYAVMEKLQETGARVTRTQFDPNGFKTDASIEEVFASVRAAGRRK